MIRRDYIRMIEQFIRALARLRSLKESRSWDEADQTLNEEFKRFVGMGAAEVERLNDTELLAQAIQGEPSLAVRDKTLLLAGLLKEAGDFAVARDQLDEGRAWHLKGLHLLLDTLSREESLDTPDCVPRVEAF